MERGKAIILIIMAAVLLSTGGVLLKFIDMNPLAIASARGIFSTAIVWIYLKKPDFTLTKAKVMGAISYGGMITGFIVANKLTTAANAIVLQFTAPIWVAILSILILKEKIKLYDVISIVLVSGGMVLFFMDDVSGGNQWGNIVAILSGVALAGSTIAMKFQKEGSTVEITLMGHMITTIVCFPFLIQEPNLTFQNFILIAILGIFQLGIAYILFAIAIKYVSALEAILIMFLEPILNPIWVFIIVGERPSVFALIGGIIVISTVALRSVYVSKNNKKEKLLENT